MRYLALLRGINVGSSGRIRMDALKHLLEEAGFCDIETYIQSGNVLFTSDLSESAARETIEHALKDGSAITTKAVLRTVQELEAMMRDCPFSPDSIAEAQAKNMDGESFYVCLLPQEPDAQTLIKLSAVEVQGDAFAVLGRDIYLLLGQSIRVSKLAIRLQKLFPDMTVRNWNTITKLSELAQRMNGG